MKKKSLNRLLVIGASGMLGNAVFRFFSQSEGFIVHGTVRSKDSVNLFAPELRANLIAGIDIENFDILALVFSQVRPDLVINCVGLVKQLSESEEALSAIPINSLFPHRLARLCAVAGARLVQISTDCVFSGKKGMYTEVDAPDAFDLYGRSKHLGEVDYAHAITLRTSIIGHELHGARSLIDWFLSQGKQVSGYRSAVFSGLPTIEIARIIKDHVIPNEMLRGLYHVSAEPINKYDLLRLVADIYQKNINIEVSDSVVIDRSLDSTKFRLATGYQPASWRALICSMKDFGRLNSKEIFNVC